MKLLGLIFVSLITTSVYSQEKLNKLSINPIQILGYNRLNVDYERGFSQGKFGINFYFGHTGNSTRKIHGQYSYLSEQSVGFKRYIKNIDKTCFWYGGLLSVSSGDIFDENMIDSATNIGALGILGSGGYQILVKHFYLNVYLNFGYAITNDLFGSAKYTGDIGRPTDFLLTYGLKIGIAF
jgi:hypothetical protein